MIACLSWWWVASDRQFGCEHFCSLINVSLSWRILTALSTCFSLYHVSIGEKCSKPISQGPEPDLDPDPFRWFQCKPGQEPVIWFKASLFWSEQAESSHCHTNSFPTATTPSAVWFSLTANSCYVATATAALLWNQTGGCFTEWPHGSVISCSRRVLLQTATSFHWRNACRPLPSKPEAELRSSSAVDDSIIWEGLSAMTTPTLSSTSVKLTELEPLRCW